MAIITVYMHTYVYIWPVVIPSLVNISNGYAHMLIAYELNDIVMNIRMCTIIAAQNRL